MKVKINFDKIAVLNFFIAHVEKLLFGFCLLILVVLLYSATEKRERFDKTPAELNNNCSAAQEKLKRQFSPDDPTFTALPDRDYHKIAQKVASFTGNTSIKVAPYQCPIAWDPPLIEQKALRDKPQLFSVEDLRGGAGFGAFSASSSGGGATRSFRRPSSSFTDEMIAPAGPTARGGRVARPPMASAAGAGDLSGKCWVVLTGLVPYEKQENAFKNAFEYSIYYDPSKDTPDYQGYWVDRAEINSPADLKNPQWSKTFMSKTVENKAENEWGGSGRQDAVPSQYIIPVLAFPLGPLVNRDWRTDTSVAHPPEIPLTYTKNMFPDGSQPQSSTGRNEPSGYEASSAKRPVNPFAGGRQRNQYRPTMQEFGAETVVREKSRFSGEFGGADAFGRSPKYRLFRFFDFTVEPGKTYLYRVRLAMKNPNYGLRPGQVKQAQLAKNFILSTPDSQSSAAITVPRDTRAFLDSVKFKPPGSYSAQVCLKKWLKDTGREVYKDFSVDIGQVLNFRDEKQAKLAPLVTSSGGYGSSQQEDAPEKVDFITDATVLDLQGGQRLIGRDRNLLEPGEMLLMNVQRNSLSLAIRFEMDDAPEIQQLKGTQESRSNALETVPRPGSNRLFEPMPQPGRPGRRPPAKNQRDGVRRLLDM